MVVDIVQNSNPTAMSKKTSQNSTTRESSSKAKTQTTAKPPPESIVHQSKGPQATAEQIRIAQILNRDEDWEFNAKVKQVVETTACSDERAAMALHDCEYNLDMAILHILEKAPEEETAEWQVSTKKHSKRSASQVHEPTPDSGNTEKEADVCESGGDTGGSLRRDKGKDKRRGGRGGPERRPRGGDRRNRSANRGQQQQQQQIENDHQTEEFTMDSWPTVDTAVCPVSDTARPVEDTWHTETNNDRDSGAMHRRSRGGSSTNGSAKGHMPPRLNNRAPPGNWRNDRNERNERNDRNDRNDRDGDAGVRRERRGGGRGGRSRGSGRVFSSNRRREDFPISGGGGPRENGPEIDTWTNEQAEQPDSRVHAAEDYWWDESGDLEGVWTGESMVVTNSSVNVDDHNRPSSVEQTDSSQLTGAGGPVVFSNSTFATSANEPEATGSAETQMAKDAYNRLATESIKNAIGIGSSNAPRGPGASTDTLAACMNAIFGQKQGVSKPPPPSTRIPEAPVQLPPPLQTAQAKVNLQFDFGTRPYAVNVQAPSTSSLPVASVANSTTPQPDQRASVSPAIPSSVPTAASVSSQSSQEHRTTPDSRILTTPQSSTGLDLGGSVSAHGTPQKPVSNQQAPGFETGATSLFESLPSEPKRTSPSGVNQSYPTSYQVSKVSTSNYASPVKATTPNAYSGAAGYASNSPYKNYSVDLQDDLSKLSMVGASPEQKDAVSNQQQLGSQQSTSVPYSPHANRTLTSQSTSMPSQQQSQTKMANASSAASGLVHTQQTMPPGMAAPPLMSHVTPYPLLGHLPPIPALDYDQLMQQHRLLMDMQHQNAVSTAGDPTKSAQHQQQVMGHMSVGMRSDVQSPPTTAVSQQQATLTQSQLQGMFLQPHIYNYYLAAQALAAQAQAGQGNQFYQQFLPQGTPGSYVQQHQSNHTPTQATAGAAGATMNAQQQPLAFSSTNKSLNSYNFSGGVNSTTPGYEDVMDLSKYQGLTGASKPGYGSMKSGVPSGYHSSSGGMQSADGSSKSSGPSGGSVGVGGPSSHHGPAAGSQGGYAQQHYNQGFAWNPYMPLAAATMPGPTQGPYHGVSSQIPTQLPGQVDSSGSRLMNPASGNPANKGMQKQAYGGNNFWPNN